MSPILKNAGALALLWLAAFNANAQVQSAAVEAAPAQAAQTEAVVADPAVWGPYAKLVGKTFAGEDLAGWPGYASKTRSIQWEVPGKVMLETGVQANGTELSKMRISPGKRPGELYFDVEKSPNATARIVDADTLEFDAMLGYRSIVQVTGPDGYEMRVEKGGEVKGSARYLDMQTAAYSAHTVELAEKAVADKHAAMLALRAAGVPDEPVTELPADRVLAYQEPVRGPWGTLRITRGKAWEASACFAAVYINGRWAGRFEDAETATFKVPAGKVQVGVGSDPKGRGTCRVGGDAQTMHDTVLAKGESLHVYFAYNSGAKFKEALLAPAATQAGAP
ncbi:hypothetical protein [Lysobacter sp. Root494]|uniref:hypothetical protein n=1 Tax=Lysobacter sp. Root494 TaxID=1736549 RepID=UPI000701FB0D|nr:hypothetical protein [Lysobacter sp. Root494]KQY54923.1 hypothetical protein ASD14_01800 [Lysobacter sp. Root494]